MLFSLTVLLCCGLEEDDTIGWRCHSIFQDIGLMMDKFPMADLQVIPRELNGLADSLLANFSRRNLYCSLFHQELDRPRSLMELVDKGGCHF